MDSKLKNTLLGFGSCLATSLAMVDSTPISIDSNKSDAEALRGDWEKVGKDMRFAMDQIDNEEKCKT